MFATIEEKLIVGALAAVALLVGILGYNHHERKEGATVCVQQQTNAATAESKKDASINESVVKDFSIDLANIPITASRTPTLFMCDAPSSVRKIAAAAGTKPAELPHSSAGPSVQARVEPGVDIGPGVQDITLSCVLAATDAQELWQLALKESEK